MEELRKAFERVAVTVQNWGRRVSRTQQDIEAIFQPNGGHYMPTPSLHQQILIHLHESAPGPRGGAFASPAARMCLSNPQKKISLKGQPSQFSDEEDEPGHELPSSAAVLYTEHINWGRKHIAILIRRTANNYSDFGDNSIVFGLYGACEKDGSFTVKKILLPEIDGNRQTSGVYPAQLSPEVVDGALRYAALCVDQVFNRRNLTPLRNMVQSGHELTWKTRNRARWASKQAGPGPSGPSAPPLFPPSP
jgi:hypothetical protein